MILFISFWEYALKTEIFGPVISNEKGKNY